MPTAPGFADCSVKIQLTSLARPAFVTFGVDPSATDPFSIANDLKAAWLATGSLNSRLDANATAVEFIIRLGSDGAEDIVGTSPNTTPGGAALTSLPPNCAVLVHKRSTRGGRRGRGRMFLPWSVAEGSVDEAGVITAGDVTALQTACSVFLGELSSRSMPMMILHKPGLSSPGPPNAVSTVQVSNLIATQRRRLGR